MNDSNSLSHTRWNGRDFYANWTLHQIIDPDQVDHLVFGGTVIPVAQGQE